MSTQASPAPIQAPVPGPAPHAPAPAASDPAPAWRALPVVLAGSFLVVLDFFIVNVALPSMQRDIGAGSGAVEWVVAGYSLACATTLIPGARLGDRFGRRRMFRLGVALFTASSAVCGIAGSPGVLVGARLAQGLAAALLSPQVLAIIGVVYTGQARVRALGAYGMSMGLAAVGGQLIGGVLIRLDVAGLGWRSCFLINVPIGIAAVALAPRLVPESRVPRTGRPDLAGTALSTVTLAAIVLPLIDGRTHGWPVWTWLCLAAVPLLGAAFVGVERRASGRGITPLVDLTLFRERPYSAGLLTQLALWSGQASFFLVFALYLQQGRGLSALQSGLVFTILAAAYLVASARAVALTERHGRRLPMLGGAALAAGHAALALAILDIGTGGSVAVLVPGLLLVGAGMGLCITPLVATVMSGLAPEHAGEASGALSTVQQVGNALGVAVTGVLFFGAARHGVGHAFEVSVIELAVVGTSVALLSRLLPGRAAR